MVATLNELHLKSPRVICMLFDYTFTAATYKCVTHKRQKARNGFLQVDVTGPLLATRTNFGNQKWSGVGPILAVKSAWSARTTFRA